MQLRPQINVKNRNTGEKHLYRLDQNEVFVGRDQSNYIVLDGRTVSRRHAEILKQGEQFFLRDLKSNNGTVLNEQRIAPQEKILLRPGDHIRIEEYDLSFNLPAADPIEQIYETTDSDILEIKMVKKLLKAMDRENAPCLEILEGPHGGKRFVLEGKSQTITIGRDPACEFFIDSNVISRKHARIEKRFDTVTLRDLGSKNGTYVNRQSSMEAQLQDGDIIHFGTLSMSFRNPQELSLELSPPLVKVKPDIETKPQPKVEKEGEEPSISVSGARASKRRDEKPQPQPHVEVPMDEPIPMDLAETGTSPLKLSPMEMVAIGIGLVVLIGAIWGIFKIL